MSLVSYVTGAGSGIGEAVVLRLLDSGHRVVAADLKFSDRLQQRAGADLALVTGDVRDAGSHEAAVGLAVESFGGLDTAVFNAGITSMSTPGSFDAALADDPFEVNVKGTALGMQAVLPALQARGAGAVVVTASVSGMAGDPHMWAYNASKAALVNMVRSWSLDYARQGIRVNAVCPGPIRTAMTDILHSGPAADLGGLLIGNVPLGRWGEPDEVAAAIEFLASPGSSFITGTTLVVDGGILAGTGQFPAPAAP